jgi:cholesterol oxidase
MAAKYDVIVIGSGFGGAVAALRLTEKNYKVLVIEAGREFADADYATSSWKLRDFLFAPAIRCFGIQRIHKLPDVLVLAGAGVGGGSLVYANTLYEPPKEFFDQGPWAKITNWQNELRPYFELSRRMLGVVVNPELTPADLAMKKVAEKFGVAETFKLAPVAVHFGQGPGIESSDPYFGGLGPSRNGCLNCGECMTGCRHNAKNTLDKNYLALARKGGAEILSMTTVTGLTESNDGWLIQTKKTGGWQKQTFSANQVVVAAGAYSTQKLLHQMKNENFLPKLSDQLGQLSRTNSEALLGAVAKKIPTPNFTRGVAITSSFFPDKFTHVEPVRYGVSSNAMGLLATVFTDGDKAKARWRIWLVEIARHPVRALKVLWVKNWSERAVIALVMQSLDNSLTVFWKKRTGIPGWKLSSRQGDGDPNPTWLPIANKVARELANVIDGEPMGNLGEVINAPFTAHFVGGCVIGESTADGVIDAYHRVFNYPGLHISDGSTISGNLGVNPSLTITAQAERAFALWPNKGQDDPRPPLGEPYLPLTRVVPSSPIVPVGAPGELRLID